MSSWAIDIRSALCPRTSGWERYVRELWKRLATSGRVQGLGRYRQGPVGRVLSDLGVGRARRFDVVHFPTFPPLPAVGGRLATLLTVHDLTWWRYRETASFGGAHYYKHLAGWAVPRSHIIVHTKAVADEVREYFDVPERRVHVVSPGVNLDVPDPEQALPPQIGGRPYLLAVASIEPRKNLHRLVRAYERSRLRDDIALVLVGRRAWGAAPTGAVWITDADDQELTCLLSRAAGLVSPSLYEGFGLPVIEALSMGTPVACSDIPVYREVGGAFVAKFDPLDEEDIAQALVELARAPRAPSAAVDWARSFSWEAAAEKLLRLYASFG